MKDVADRKHLQLRQTVWHYRRRVPEPLVEAFGKPYVHQSLKTGSIKEALQLRNCLDVKFDAEFASLSAVAVKLDATKKLPVVLEKKSAPQPLNRTQVVNRVADYVGEKIGKFARWNEIDPIDSEPVKNDIEQERQEAMKALAQPGNLHRDEWVSQAFAHLFPKRVFADVSNDQAAEIIRRGLIEIVRGELAVLADEHDRQIADPLFKRQPSERITFGDVARDYIGRETENARINGYRDQWVEKVNAGVEFLIECVGVQTPIISVDFDACSRVQAVIANVPRNRTRLYPNLSLDEAIRCGREDKAPTLSSDTQGRYLDFFKGIMDLAEDKRLIQNNPSRRIRPLRRDKIADRDKRKPFTVEQITKFFGSPFYQKWSTGEKCTYLKKDRDWRFWLPLLLTFSGMRPNEACQMLVSDIQQTEAGTWYADVVASDDSDENADQTKTLKTVQSRRRYPLHPVLIEAGFLEFVEHRQTEGKTVRLFAGLVPGEKGYLSDYPSKRFRNIYLPEAISLEQRQTFYSFRHTFRDALRRIDAPNDVVAALGGWSEGTKVSDAYGDAANPDYLASYVAKIDYPGLKVEFRYTSLPDKK